MRALACPASFKGVLSAFAAAKALGEGLEAGGAQVELLPVADGGEGTAEVLARGARRASGARRRSPTRSGGPSSARWLLLPDGTGVVEAAAAVGLPLLAPGELDPLRASSRGFGELVAAALAGGARSLLLCLGGGRDGRRRRGDARGARGGARALGNTVLQGSRVACDVSTRLADAARLYGPQKGASPDGRRGARAAARGGWTSCGPTPSCPGAGAAGGLGAALAALGAELVPGAMLVLETIGFRERLDGAALAVTGEGQVDRTTAEGKAPGAVAAVCREAGVRCVVAGGRVVEPVPGTETVALSGDPERAEDDLRVLGERLARSAA